MNEKKLCQRCKKEFEPKSNSQKYCLECANEIITETHREYIKNQRETVKNAHKIQEQVNEYNARLARQLFPEGCDDDKEVDVAKVISSINSIPKVKDNDKK